MTAGCSIFMCQQEQARSCCSIRDECLVTAIQRLITQVRVVFLVITNHWSVECPSIHASGRCICRLFGVKELTGSSPTSSGMKHGDPLLLTIMSSAVRTCTCRYGVWADWSAPYVTLQPSYEAAQLGVFGRMFLNGHVYRCVW